MTNYRERLIIPVDEGNDNLEFYTSSGTFISRGYRRIVIGDRGPYVEFKSHHMRASALKIPDDQKHRLNEENKGVYYYAELRSDDESNVKVYYQLKTVDYADYKVKKFYISPFDLYIKQGNELKVLIEPLREKKK